MKYYSYPDYQGSLPYALLEEEIADYLINEVQNGFSGTKVVNFNNGVPTEEQQSMITSKVMNKLTGSRGQKVIVAFNDNAESKTTVEDIPLNDAPEHYTYLSEECLRKIMLGHNVTSPLLFGVASSNGFSSNADELKNSAILFDNMVIRPMQEEMLEAFDTILAVNGISLKLFFKTLQPLEFTDLENTQTEEQVAEETGTELSKQDALDNQIADALIECGEVVDENWILIDEFEVDYDQEDAIDLEIENANNKKQSLLSKVYNFVSTGTANPRAKSEQDATVDGFKFMTRYRYNGGVKENSREFCKKMVAADKVYRKEDIVRMGSQVVNAGWGARGADTYDIFLYKGGGSCHHKWMRQTFVAYEAGRGIDPLSPNAKTISTNKAEKAGYRVRNPQQVAMRPVDMPNQGFLPTNKRFN
jgi:hypothetical protein